ncbi:hypothetical protein KAR91_07855 [Candidatus Pacearchaeota archaeon]|nr:hypothetical protein [Candidatus Pacearchaeota archaeon]
MNTEQKQLKNIRNRVMEFIKKTTPEKLIKVALFLRIKIPKELVDKYTK